MEPNETGTRKKTRSIVADDSQWNLIRGRARAAGMSVSQFAVERALEPARSAEEGDDLPVAVRRRALVDVRALVLAEQLRFEQAGEGATWRRLVEEAEASVARDEGEG